MYPSSASYTADDDLNSIEYQNWDMTIMPLIMGEYGGLKYFFSNEADAVTPINNLLDTMLNHRGFTGALYWTWDTEKINDHWTLQGEQQLIKPVVQEFFSNY